MNALATPFYLTGGTALSRYYFQHRYSDDLDFFVNGDSAYADYVQSLIHALKKQGGPMGFSLDTQSLSKGEYFTQFFIRRPQPSGDDVLLKIDLINHRILTSFPAKELKYIKWITSIDTPRFVAILGRMAEDILLGRDNSLVG